MSASPWSVFKRAELGVVEVLPLFGEGDANAIATRLFVSVRTGENHGSSSLGKLRVAGRSQLWPRVSGMIANGRF